MQTRSLTAQELSPKVQGAAGVGLARCSAAAGDLLPWGRACAKMDASAAEGPVEQQDAADEALLEWSLAADLGVLQSL